MIYLQFDRMNHFYSKRLLSIHHIILFTVFLICFFPSAANSCSLVDTLDIIQLCSVDDPGLTLNAQTDLGLSADETDQDDHCMLGNCIRQTGRSLRLSPTPPLRSLAPSSSSYSVTSRAFPTGYTLASTLNLKQASTMVSSSSPSSSHLPAETPTNEQQQQQANAENEANNNNNNNNQNLALPPVPENNSEAQKLDVSGQTDTTVSLDHLGPIVVNQDGTMSRISNWDKMTEVERKNTLRIIGKRNKQRLEALRAAGVS